jgi:two-component system response regulator YesN
MRILIVEDEIKIRRGLASLISKHTEHIVVGEAKNGLEGFEMAERFQPDLVITDVRMPVMDGLEMIRRMREKKMPQLFLILSGYSEFEYARKAIKYGCEDYLLKPLAPEDITETLRRIEEKLEKEIKPPEKVERIFRDYLIGNGEQQFNEEELAKKAGFSADGRYIMISAYMNWSGIDQKKNCVQWLEKLKEKNAITVVYFFIESSGELICIMKEESWNKVKKQIEERLISNPVFKRGWVWCRNQADTITGLKEIYRKKLREQYMYSMVLGEDRLLDNAQIQAFEPEEYQYPRYLEHRMQEAVLGSHPEELRAAGTEFMNVMRTIKVRPAQISESYMKMCSFLFTLLYDMRKNIYDQMEKLEPIKNIGAAVTSQNLEKIFSEILHVIAEGIEQKENIRNYAIRRAIDYIRLHYQESISLEDVAGRLDITPEYLSTLFNREMGQNFSVFLKKFRISHAKRLLKGTNKKIYEISKEVGYTDPKYFNRVFKEEEGVSPGDYRALNR